MATAEVKGVAYAVWDTETNQWWRTRSGKMTWRRRGDAANAWNVVRKYGQPKFSEQTRFEVHLVSFFSLETLCRD